MTELIELYQLENCPYCRRVREKLGELGLDFIVRQVGSERSKVKNVSGQEAVPVLVDGDKVVSDSEKIIEYLEENY